MRSIPLLLLLLLLAMGCPTEQPRDTGPKDWDVDGWYGRADCDDGDREINPDASEICDGKDNDCDGEIDEDFADSLTWWADSDGDGYGDPLVRTQHCEQPEGWVDDNTDCDDGDASVFPGAEETWYDGVDGDCDRQSDHDADGDGWDWEGTGGRDCDDDDPSVYPGPLDWQDGADSDCDGYADVSPLAEHGTAVLGTTGGGELASALALVDDQDGDGRPDLLLGSPGMGAAWLVSSPIAAETELPSAALARLSGRTSTGQAGAAVADAGDVNGDGQGDLVVGAWLEADGAGQAALLLGPVLDDRQLDEADWLLEGERAGDYLGYAVAGAGDTDGDGFDDLLLGARGWQDTVSDAGAAYLLAGGVHPPASLSEASAVIHGGQERDFAGCAVLGPGDLDGDGLSDLVVGARGEDSGGGAYLFFGPVSGLRELSEADVGIPGEDELDHLGWALAAAGDTDGDGYPDLLVGGYGHDGLGSNTGAAWLFRGRARESWLALEGTDEADATFHGERTGDHAGWAVGGPGDTDGDGRDDVLVGAPGADGDDDDEGRVFLLLQPSAGSVSLGDADLGLRGEAGSQAGAALAPAGDHDGDGLPDLFMGLPGHEDGAAGAGAAWVLGLGE